MHHEAYNHDDNTNDYNAVKYTPEQFLAEVIVLKMIIDNRQKDTIYNDCND